MSLLDVDWPAVVSHLATLAVAYLLSLPIGWNREQNARSAGMRTFPLVAIATCGFILLGKDIVGESDSLARIVAGVITGIGFIGGGSILKGEHMVSGTATAASLWSTGAIGVAVALGRLEIAVTLSVITFATLQLTPMVKPLVIAADDDEDVQQQ